MKKYKDLSTIAELQNKIDQKYGRGKYQAFFILLLFMCLTFTSCANEKTPAQELVERQQQEQRTQQNQRTAGTRITITNTGQIRELEEEPVDLNDGLQRISRAYFAKKTVTQNGTQVNFEQINDSILGKVVYLVLETDNMAGMSIDVVIRPADATLTGSTDTLTVTHLQPPTAAGQQQTTVFTQIITTTVGNLDALNNNQGSRTHYTNLATYNNKAIIKLRLCPATRTVFNTWAQNLGTGTANLEIVVERHDNNLCAYGDSDEEVAGAGTFLNDDTRENHRFSVANKNFYEIYAPVFRERTNNRNYYDANPYNFLRMDGNNRKKIAYLNNNNSTVVEYFYYDRYGNEIEITSCNKTTVMGRRNGIILNNVPIEYIRREDAPIGGNAQYNYIYANGDIVTDGNHVNERNPYIGQHRKVRYAESGTNVDLIRMPDGLNRNVDTNTTITFGFSGTQRRYCNPECFAAFIGILGQYGTTGVNCTGMCFGDATSYPSVSHPNGDSVDTSYMADRTNQQNLLYAFVDWNFTNVLAAQNRQSWLLGAHRYNGEHNSHLHSGDFDSNSIDSII